MCYVNSRLGPLKRESDRPANKQRWIMKQLRCINDAARDILVATSKVTLPKGSRARKFASNPLSGSPELSQPT
jgi:hypothetical protein